MFTLDDVTLRPLEFADIDALYRWHTDTELAMWAGWERPSSRARYQRKYERRITEPEDDLIMLGVTLEGQLVGYVQLALIDRIERRAAVGIVIGEKALWGRGVGAKALRILLDYAFTDLCLERIFAEVYGFNVRSQRLMTRVGFQSEGVLRKHEMHMGQRQDMYVYGMLRDEFYTTYPTLFPLPTEPSA